MPASLKLKLTSWEVLNTNLKPQIAELPHLQEDQAEFERLLGEMVALEARQGAEIAALRFTNQQRAELLKQGTELYERLGAALRHKFGPTNKKLHEFGIRPRSTRRRPSTKKKETAEPNKPAADAPATPSLPPQP